MTLRVGQRAPDFDVTTSGGERLKLSDYRGKKNVVVYFYPGDFTPVCTKETCGFRDAYGELEESETVVVGVSVDDDGSHRSFAAKHQVPFALVSDPQMELAARFEASSLLRSLLNKAARVTYVIDKKGEVAGVFKAELSASAHVDGVRALVRKLASR